MKPITGQEPFKDKLEPLQLSSHGALTRIVAVRLHSDINSIYDLEGKGRSFSGAARGGVATDVSNYFRLAGINIEPIFLDIAQTGDAFIAGRADAALLLFRNGQPYPLNMEVEAAMDINTLPWDPKVNKQMVEITAGIREVITRMHHLL